MEEFLTSYPEQTEQVAQLLGHTLGKFASIPFAKPGFLSSQLSLAQPIRRGSDGYLDYMNGILSESLAAEHLEKIREHRYGNMSVFMPKAWTRFRQLTI